MLPELQMLPLNKTKYDIKDFEDIMSSLYFNEKNSFIETEKKIILPYWKRFGYFYSLNSVFALLTVGYHHNPLLNILTLTVPAILGLYFASEKKSSRTIFNILSFGSYKFRLNAKLISDIEKYKKKIALPILSVKHNQQILLEYYANFYQTNKIFLSNAVNEEIDNLKFYFENSQLENALDCLYSLYQKVQHINSFDKVKINNSIEDIFIKHI